MMIFIADGKNIRALCSESEVKRFFKDKN